MTRIQAWSVAFNVAKDHPFVGGGFDYENYPDPNRWLSYADRKYDSVDQTPRAAHSIYFQVLGQHGFVGFGIFMALMGLAFLSFSGIARDVRSIPELGWLGRYAKAMQVGMIGYLVSGAFLNLAYFDLIYLYIGLIAIFRREIREFRVANPATAGASSVSMVAAMVKKPMNQSG
jgi:probable O-glycosylation ligase (exosortase A-associated)